MSKINKIRNILEFFLFIAVVLSVFPDVSASEVEQTGRGKEALLDIYNRNTAQLEENSIGFPLVMESYEQGSRVHVDVYGIFNYPADGIIDVLRVPANWCDIASLHTNVKACTYKELSGTWLMTFYIGGEGYQPLEDTRPVIYNYRNADEQQGYLDITFSADAGPFGTKDHKMRFEAVQLDEGRTFVHVSYEYSDSVLVRFAGNLYFLTLGRSKVGFTVTGTDKHGKPIYIGGARGSIERNAVRYYFAIQSFMNTLSYPEESRLNMRLSEWYDITSRYRKQFYELDKLEKKDYLAFKTKEHMNQITLQMFISTGHQ
ncbi:MAG: hypothetical protein HQK99_15940 [Nitrospirae bacterium]|nr:hypothetical protein [Nitrospirota bacterium]